MKKKGQEKKTTGQKTNSDKLTDVSNATTHWGWQEKPVLWESAAAICLHRAAGDEMLLLMKWDCSVLWIYCSECSQF